MQRRKRRVLRSRNKLRIYFDNFKNLISWKRSAFFATYFLILVLVSSLNEILALQKPATLPRIASAVPTLMPSPTAMPTPEPTIPPTATSAPLPTDAPPSPMPASDDYCLTVPVLMYHHVQPLGEAQAKGETSLTVDTSYFESHMSYLQEQGYRSISPEELASALLDKRDIGKAVVVTLDDGYEDNYIYAFPIMKKFNITGNIMIPTGLMNNPGYLNWDKIKEMKNSGVNFYNHTWSHASLGRAGKDKIESEISLSAGQMESNLGLKPGIFSYPYGSESPMVISILKEHGFFGGLSTMPGKYQCRSFVMTLHRTRIGNAPLSSYGI